MTKVSIINVELNDEIQNIIDDGLTTLTKRNVTEIEHAITQQQLIKQYVEKKNQDKLLKEQASKQEDELYQQVADTLLQKAMTLDELKVIGNMPASVLMTKVRGYLKRVHSPQVVVKEVIGKVTKYSVRQPNA